LDASIVFLEKILTLLKRLEKEVELVMASYLVLNAGDEALGPPINSGRQVNV
jgi:hypothetical protein